MFYDEALSIATLGKGKFGKVYCCKSPDGSKFVAVKRYNRGDATASAGKIERILMEKKVLSLLSAEPHPNIVSFIETQKDDESLFFILEAILAGSLDRHIASSTYGRIHPTVAVRYMTEIVSAVEYMFLHGVVHRDLKSKNCVINSNGHLKICDFGSSKHLVDRVPEQLYSSCHARTFTLTGTFHFMAPEMVARCVDWWALGLLLWEMLCGQYPLLGRAVVSVDDNLSAIDERASMEAQTAIDDCRAIFTNNDEAAHIIFDQVQVVETSRSTVEAQQGDRLTESKSSTCFHKGPWWPIFDETASTLFSIESNSAALDFIARLMVPAPDLRLGGEANIAAITHHPIFIGTDWDAIRQGVSPPPDVDFNRRIGFLDILERSSKDPHDEISVEDQALFDGF